MPKYEKSITDLMQEVKEDLDFLPEVDEVRVSFLFAFEYMLIS
ncbi:hypothetical protein [Alkalibacter mobilis]|nr:hypothetical protein [Alkalibacter mobilis]